MPRKGKYTIERQEKIMEFLEKYQDENLYSPSIREIGDYIGVPSTSLVDYYIRQLIHMGYLDRDEHISRSLRVVRPYNQTNTDKSRPVSYKRRDVVRFQILGRIVASAPIPVPGSDLTYYDEESFIEVPRKMLPEDEPMEELFVLEVSGDSMIDAMINDGDKVIFRQASDAQNGDMVAVWLSDNEETTLKYYYNEGDRVRLQPANPTMDPIYINNPEQVHIMGKVVMVIRHL
ncbi:MAG: repressor LexA [Anaerolineaceae bacterium]|nr:repressor LexA [Anaerolineaceae bacterium]